MPHHGVPGLSTLYLPCIPACLPTSQGRVRPVAPESQERTSLREAFLAKYPDAFWVDFGDFRWGGYWVSQRGRLLCLTSSSTWRPLGEN
jgi:hypothetical protein